GVRRRRTVARLHHQAAGELGQLNRLTAFRLMLTDLLRGRAPNDLEPCLRGGAEAGPRAARKFLNPLTHRGHNLVEIRHLALPRPPEGIRQDRGQLPGQFASLATVPAVLRERPRRCPAEKAEPAFGQTDYAPLSFEKDKLKRAASPPGYRR